VSWIKINPCQPWNFSSLVSRSSLVHICLRRLRRKSPYNFRAGNCLSTRWLLLFKSSSTSLSSSSCLLCVVMDRRGASSFARRRQNPLNAHSHLQRAWHSIIIIIVIFYFSFPSTEASLQSSYQSDLSVHICAQMKEVKNIAIYFMFHKYLFVTMRFGNF
jgi:hypothetical protein